MTQDCHSLNRLCTIADRVQYWSKCRKPSRSSSIHLQQSLCGVRNEEPFVWAWSTFPVWCCFVCFLLLVVHYSYSFFPFVLTLHMFAGMNCLQMASIGTSKAWVSERQSERMLAIILSTALLFAQNECSVLALENTLWHLLSSAFCPACTHIIDGYFGSLDRQRQAVLLEQLGFQVFDLQLLTQFVYQSRACDMFQALHSVCFAYQLVDLGDVPVCIQDKCFPLTCWIQLFSPL